ncbi:MAG TPA: hypothetical protein DCY13_07330 [Verrucomicrobiales bacterium]|nr:hypothetical protein [Verrucomicrobiales bacterium]
MNTKKTVPIRHAFAVVVAVLALGSTSALASQGTKGAAIQLELSRGGSRQPAAIGGRSDRVAAHIAVPKGAGRLLESSRGKLAADQATAMTTAKTDRSNAPGSSGNRKGAARLLELSRDP